MDRERSQVIRKRNAKERPLLYLPPELRNKIYECYLSNHTIIIRSVEPYDGSMWCRFEVHTYTGEDHSRFLDSIDTQSEHLEHLLAVLQVCRQFHETSHWIEFIMLVGDSRASAIRKVRILLCAEDWWRSELDRPVEEPKISVETLRRFVMKCTNLKHIIFDNGEGCMGWYHCVPAAETVKDVREVFREDEALRHVVISGIHKRALRTQKSYRSGKHEMP